MRLDRRAENPLQAEPVDLPPDGLSYLSKLTLAAVAVVVVVSVLWRYYVTHH